MMRIEEINAAVATFFTSYIILMTLGRVHGFHEIKNDGMIENQLLSDFMEYLYEHVDAFLSSTADQISSFDEEEMDSSTREFGKFFFVKKHGKLISTLKQLLPLHPTDDLKSLIQRIGKLEAVGKDVYADQLKGLTELRQEFFASKSMIEYEKIIGLYFEILRNAPLTPKPKKNLFYKVVTNLTNVYIRATALDFIISEEFLITNSIIYRIHSLERKRDNILMDTFIHLINYDKNKFIKKSTKFLEQGQSTLRSYSIRSIIENYVTPSLKIGTSVDLMCQRAQFITEAIQCKYYLRIATMIKPVNTKPLAIEMSHQSTIYRAGDVDIYVVWNDRSSKSKKYQNEEPLLHKIELIIRNVRDKIVDKNSIAPLKNLSQTIDEIKAQFSENNIKFTFYVVFKSWANVPHCVVASPKTVIKETLYVWKPEGLQTYDVYVGI